MKQYIIFAGVNGAGKSTLYQTNKKLFLLPRINMDERVLKGGMVLRNKILRKGILSRFVD